MPACARKCQICSCWPRRAAAAHRAPRKKTQRAGDERIRDAKDLLRSLAGHDMADDRQGGCTEDRGDERPKHFGGLRHNLYLSTAKLPVFFPEVRVDLKLFCKFWFQFGRWSEINNLAGDTIFEVARVGFQFASYRRSSCSSVGFGFTRWPPMSGGSVTRRVGFGLGADF